jgi:hypothetical protein
VLARFFLVFCGGGAPAVDPGGPGGPARVVDGGDDDGGAMQADADVPHERAPRVVRAGWGP